MKKFYITKIDKNGESKRVFVLLDNKTSAIVEKLDSNIKDAYLHDEYENKMKQTNYRRYNVSLEKSVDKGLDLVDNNQDFEENIFDNFELENLYDAINKLTKSQQWLIEQVYYNNKTRVEIAKELGVGATAIRNRLQKIYRKIKKNLN